MKCRSCNGVDALPVLDFGSLPPANSYPEKGTDPETEPRYPLRVFVCRSCWLMQTEDKVDKKLLFNDSYAYHSSHSSSLLKHSADYASKMIKGLGLTSDDMVVEVASNDGYLLQYFDVAGIRTLGIEPTGASAEIARKKGLETIGEFFGLNLASELKSRGISPRLMIGNNVLAHVPDINDFVSGFAEMLGTQGVATFEFPNLSNLLKNGLYDSVYHEHFSYLSASNAVDIFSKNKMRVFRVEPIATHGGSLRVYVAGEASSRTTEKSVENACRRDVSEGLRDVNTYKFAQKAASNHAKALYESLKARKESGATIYGYGAAAKSSTILNIAAIGNSIIDGVIDSNPAKQNRQIPGTGIPIYSVEEVSRKKPDKIVIFPWNLMDEIVDNIKIHFPHQPEILIPQFLPAELMNDLRSRLKYQNLGSLDEQKYSG